MIINSTGVFVGSQGLFSAHRIFAAQGVFGVSNNISEGGGGTTPTGRVTESGDVRVTESGDTRVIE